MSVTPIEFYPKTEDDTKLISNTIHRAINIFNMTSYEAVMKAFSLLGTELDLHEEAQKKVHSDEYFQHKGNK